MNDPPAVARHPQRSSGEGGGCVSRADPGVLQVFDSRLAAASFGPVVTSAGGGAIRTNGSLCLTRTRFSNNQSSDFGIVNPSMPAAQCASTANATSVLIERTQFVANKTIATPASATTCIGGQGGALALSLPASASAYLSDVQFIDNATTCLTTGSRQAGNAGALSVLGQGTSSIVVLERAYFGQNEARTAGAIHVESARPTSSTARSSRTPASPPAASTC